MRIENMKKEKTSLLPSKYEVLKEVVNDYPGILNSAAELVFKLDQHQKKWGIILRELRAYALQNFYLHDHHENGVEAVGTIIDVFMEALHSPDSNIQEAAVNGLLFYIDKILSDGGQNLRKYSEVLRNCFHLLSNLPEPQFFLFTVNPLQIKKPAQVVLEKMPQDFEFAALNKLLFRHLLTTYEYWLQEEDPFVSFKSRMGQGLSEGACKEIEELLYPVSHSNFRGLITYLNTLKESGTDVSFGCLKELLELQGYLQVAGFYQDLIT